MDRVLYQYFRYRKHTIDRVTYDPLTYQTKLLSRIISQNKGTEYGQTHNFGDILDYNMYSNQVPVQTYNDLCPLITRMTKGEPNILCHSPIKWFAKSSGTSARSKYIPVSQKQLIDGHLKCTWDMACHIYNENPNAKLFADKTLIMGGSMKEISKNIFCGDISAILLHNFPAIGRRFYVPRFETALLDDWEEKIRAIAQETINENVTLIGGVPTWTIILMEEVLRQSGKRHISEVWPNLKSFIHGGISFEPYRQQISDIINSDKVTYRNVYNASEGYFAMQDISNEPGMLLLCNHEIYYEFKNLETSAIMPLAEVKSHHQYVLIITNSSGLYRYDTGDIIEFVSIEPYRIIYQGRTTQSINAFGEEIMLHNTEEAIATVCRSHGVMIQDYSVGPYPMIGGHSGYHEWVIEFINDLEDLGSFEKDLDNTLRLLNSDYDAKRSYDMVLQNLKVRIALRGTFKTYLKSKNKYGGQNKVVRLSNDRTIIEELLSLQTTLQHST